MAALNLQHRGFCCVGPFGYTPSGRSFTPRKKLPSKGNFTISDAWRRKTGARSKKKQKADVAAAAAAMGAKKVLGQHLVDETMLARVGADRGEEVSESLFVAIEWLIHGEWRAAGKPDDAAFYGARWFGQAALREVLRPRTGRRADCRRADGRRRADCRSGSSSQQKACAHGGDGAHRATVGSAAARSRAPRRTCARARARGACTARRADVLF